MSDQCLHCVLRGDFEKCTDTVCGHHENWIVVELNSRMVAATLAERERIAIEGQKLVRMQIPQGLALYISELQRVCAEPKYRWKTGEEFIEGACSDKREKKIVLYGFNAARQTE